MRWKRSIRQLALIPTVGIAVLLLALAILAITDAAYQSIYRGERGSGRQLIYLWREPASSVSSSGLDPDYWWLVTPPGYCTAPGVATPAVVLSPEQQDERFLFELAWDAQYRKAADRIDGIDLERFTSAFERTLLADCLIFPGFNRLCRWRVASLVATAENRTRSELAKENLDLRRNWGPPICALFGLRLSPSVLARDGSRH